MPYKAEKRGDDWVVINTDTQDIKATHTGPHAEEMAKRQVRLLEEIEHEDG